MLIALVAWSHSLYLTYLLLFASGVTLMMVVSCLMSLVQLIAPNEMRGRVMSIYLVAFRGGMPLGSLVSGYFASIRLGAERHRVQRRRTPCGERVLPAENERNQSAVIQ